MFWLFVTNNDDDRSSRFRLHPHERASRRASLDAAQKAGESSRSSNAPTSVARLNESRRCAATKHADYKTKNDVAKIDPISVFTSASSSLVAARRRLSLVVVVFVVRRREGAQISAAATMAAAATATIAPALADSSTPPSPPSPLSPTAVLRTILAKSCRRRSFDRATRRKVRTHALAFGVSLAARRVSPLFALLTFDDDEEKKKKNWQQMRAPSTLRCSRLRMPNDERAKIVFVCHAALDAFCRSPLARHDSGFLCCCNAKRSSGALCVMRRAS